MAINTESFQELLKSLKMTYQENLCFRYFENSWIDTSYNQFYENCKKLSSFFIRKNLENKNILLLSESRPEVIEVYFSAFSTNSIIVPLDVKLSPREISIIIKEVDPALVITTKAQFETLNEAAKLLDFDLSIISINPIPGYYNLGETPTDTVTKLPKENPDKTGMIIYTSGSTGNMKGVETKGSQLLFQIHSLMSIGFETGKHRNLSMLPMNHLFEVSGTLSSLAAGFPICVAHSLEKSDLGLCFQKHRPTQIFSVPLFCKSIMNGVKLNIVDSPPIKKIVFSLLTLIGKTFKNKKLSKKLFSPIHDKFGGCLERIIVGGAAADLSVIKFFETIGITIYEGYGLTETAPVIAVNRIENLNPGSVGQLIPGVEARIDKASGEILTKGPHIMNGYYKNTDATLNVLSQDGWFRTGDIGHLDQDGYLFITGRSKNLIVLENGKKVHPEEIEKVFDDIEYIEEISIFGDNTEGTTNSKEIIMIVYLSSSFTEKYKRESLSILLNDVQKKSVNLAQYKMPSKIKISQNELPKTTTMKVRHFQVAKEYKSKRLRFLYQDTR